MDCCGKIFKQKTNFYRHQRLKHPVSPYSAKYDCIMCKLSFSRKDNYERHMLKAHKPEESELLKLMQLHKNLISTQCKQQKHVDIYNYQLSGLDMKVLKLQLHEIFRAQTKAFKINLSFAFVLRNILTNELRYYYSCQNNTRIFPVPMLITKLDDLAKVTEAFEKADVLEFARQQRDNSQWVVELIPNVTYYVYKLLNHPIGSAINLPNYIRNNNALIALLYDRILNKDLNDGLCFFRCLALHQGYSTKNFESVVKNMVESYGKSVLINELHEVENHFKVNIFVYTLLENGSAELVRRPSSKFPSTMYVNLYEDHFSYIVDIKRYTKTFVCPKCEFIFPTAYRLDRHERTCKAGVRYHYPGGAYIPKPSEQKFYPYKATYDIECMQPNDVHVLLSISVCSNVPKFELPVCFSSKGDENALVSQFLAYLQTIAKHARTLLGPDFILPVIGFFSGRYDLNVLKKFLFPKIDILHVIKKSNSYMSVSTSNFQFLDIKNYLAPGYSYAQFLKAYDCAEKKGFFPFDWMDSLEKLNHPTLPPLSAFYSKLKDTNISADDYQICIQAWKDNGMKTMEDFLIWYNNRDVLPFIEAIDKMEDFYKARNLDMFRDGISVPGLTLKYLFSTLEHDIFFALPGKGWEHVYHLIKDNIVGGPSIIFHRYHEKGKTLIRSTKLCQKVVGYDANSLYLWAIMQDMPTGQMSRRLEKNKFRRETPYGVMAHQWLTTVAREQEIHIQHKYNSKEFRIKNRPVDGYCAETNTIYQFHGCLFHGHPNCPIIGDRSINPVNGKAFAMLHVQTLAWDDEVRELGYTLVIKYECVWKEEHPQPPPKPPLRDVTDMVQAIMSEQLFGIVECDIRVPNHLKEHFADFPPIFKNTDISINDVGPYNKAYALDHDLLKHPRRSLISSYFGEKIALATPLIKWYLENGLEITRIYQVVEYSPAKCFEKFGNQVTKARIEGDKHPDKAIIADSMKLIGNSSYGKTVTNKEKFVETCYSSGHNIKASHPRFQHAEEIADDFYEIQLQKGTIRADLPNQIGFFVYQYAKLRMLQFYYDFLLKFVAQSDFQLCAMDTDSAYLAITGSNMGEIVKPELKEQYQAEKHLWLADEANKRTPGLFKLEWAGDGIIALCSKTYFCFGPQNKFSSKGANRSQVNVDMFLDVLKNKKAATVQNRGFKLKGREMVNYVQNKDAISYFYPKRIVLDDGVSTLPLLL